MLTVMFNIHSSSWRQAGTDVLGDQKSVFEILITFHHCCTTRCHILRPKCTKFDFGWGCAPDLTGYIGATTFGKMRGTNPINPFHPHPLPLLPPRPFPHVLLFFLPLPCTFHSSPFPFLPLSPFLPVPPLRSRPPLIQLWGLGSAV